MSWPRLSFTQGQNAEVDARANAVARALIVPTRPCFPFAMALGVVRLVPPLRRSPVPVIAAPNPLPHRLSEMPPPTAGA
jgi:hypothetical protein